VIATLRLQWPRGDARFLAWADASFAAMFLVGLPAGFERGRVLAGFALAACAILPAWASRRAVQVMRAPDPELGLRDDGGIELRHPMLAEPLALAASDIHSLWQGPFEQPPPLGRRDFWVGRRGFPTNVLLDVSDVGRAGESDDVLVIVFTRALVLVPQLRLARWVWVLHRMWPDLGRVDAVHGVIAHAQDAAAARALLAASGRAHPTMPDDVRLWLGWPDPLP
jgi:hypothetical protein